jgi:hypothetical protein
MNKIGDAVRLVFLFMCMLCCLWCFIACLAGKDSEAIALGAAGIAFWTMSFRLYDDFDAM